MKLETLYKLITAFVEDERAGYLSDNDSLKDLLTTFFNEHNLVLKVDLSFFVMVLEAFSDHDEKTADGLWNIWNWAFTELIAGFYAEFEDGVK